MSVVEKLRLSGANKRVFEIFEDLCAIPHGSGNEAGIAEYIGRFAGARGLYHIHDAVGNVFVGLPATDGFVGREPILLQGHMDMVCEKNSDVIHDFLRDGLDLYIENGKLRARGTTLGGDDGIAVAMMLTVLDGAIPCHPEVECLFTVEEETGLRGATNFDYSVIHSRRMINLDSEDENIVTCGCAGGIRTEIKIEGKRGEYSGEYVVVTVKGLCGGHSGAEIHKGRANANKLMGRILAASAKYISGIVSVDGGSKDNAIPRECCAVVACDDADALSRSVGKIADAIRGELCAEDEGFVCECKPVKSDIGCLDTAATTGIITVLCCAANGVLAMSNRIPGLVEYSRNLGVVVTDGDSVIFTFSSRSAKESQIDCSISELDTLAAAVGATAVHYSRYPGWDYSGNSALRERYLAVYEKLYGKCPEVTVIHAGLECGIIGSKIPGIDMISIGPDMRAIHSPDEALDIESCGRVFAAVAGVISAE